MPRGTLSCPPPSSDQAGPEETRFLWTVFHLCAVSPQPGQAHAQTGMETALHRTPWAIHPLHRLLGLGHSRVRTAQGMLSVQIKVTTNWLFSKSLPGCGWCWCLFKNSFAGWLCWSTVVRGQTASAHGHVQQLLQQKTALSGHIPVMLVARKSWVTWQPESPWTEQGLQTNARG